MNGSEINETGYWALDIDGITAKPIMPKPLKPEPSPSKLLSGFISRDEVYTLPELQRRLVIRPAAWRVLRRKGLPFYQVGKRILVFGQDFFEFVRAQGQPE